MEAAEYQHLLKNAKSILLVDWLDESVPAALVKAGYMVYSYAPDQYCSVEFTGDQVSFKDIQGLPPSVDIVNVFRPEAEHAAIIAELVLPLKAGVLWLHPPVTSAATAALAAQYGIKFIERINIADAVEQL